jgi:hypothetical protein
MLQELMASRINGFRNKWLREQTVSGIIGFRNEWLQK